ncbi:MAG: DNA translocase FtsK [Thermodesulfobacteriota bacterium]
MAETRENFKGVRQEITGVALMAAALYTAISLYSYNETSNWGGVVGEFLSALLLGSIGYASYLFPLLLGVVSVELLLRRDFTFRASIPVGFVVFVGSLAALASGVTARGGEGGGVAGGWIGEFLSRHLINYLGFSGAMIMLAAVVVIATLVATGLSVFHTLTVAVPRGFSLVRSAVRAVAWRGGDQAEEAENARPRGARKISVAAPAPGAGTGAPPIITPGARSAGKGAKNKGEAADEAAEELEFTSPRGDFKLPPLSLLDRAPARKDVIDDKTLLENSRLLAGKLADFGIDGRVVEVRPGPVVTMYEFEPAPGIKVGRIVNLADDLTLAMKAMSVRIIAPVPGKSVVGIEVPNPTRHVINFRELLQCEAFSRSRSTLSLALGQDISGGPYVTDFARMPHLLIAGATGTGKSVAVNAMILSILFKATPEDVRFVMVDPKMLELSAYEGIPHLITPVITDSKKAAGALKSIVSEMGRRYRLMSMKGARNIDRYNQIVEAGESAGPAGRAKKAADRDKSAAGAGAEEVHEAAEEEHTRLPYIVVVIDELADLMMTSGKDVEECLVRLSQMARAAGIHLLVATQRPSVDVVTGLVKTNFPARIAFQLPSRTDSRTILDTGGAETLLGEGDMLFLPPGTSKLRRVHGVYVSETEIKKVTDFWKKQGSPVYDRVLIEESESYSGADDGEETDPEFLKRYDEAVNLASTLDMISTSYVQRRFRIGYNTAARIIEKMEKEGVVGPSQGSRPREVLINRH